MSKHTLELQELATLVAEVIRRMGASYGTSDEWRRDFTRAVKVMEHFVAIAKPRVEANG